MLSEQINKVKKYISSNRLDDAMELLKLISVDYNNQLQNEIISLKAQYHDLQRKKRIGVISFSEKRITQNKITHSLLEILNSIKEEEVEKKTYDLNQYSEIRILFISSGPDNINRLRLDEEFRSINKSMLSSDNRDKFKLNKIYATRISDLIEVFSEYKPQFVHFSGHGSKKGIFLNDFDNDERVISNNALGKIFELFSDTIQCVFLSSSYSESQAETISKHVPYVIGLRDLISDKDAIIFSSAFYKAIGLGQSIETAFEMANLNLELLSKYEKLLPILKKK